MKQITKPNTNYARNLEINEALGFFRNEMMANHGETDYDTRRWVTTLYTDKYGRLGLLDTRDDNADYGLTLFEHQGDIFFVPGFAEDGWSGTSLKGQSYEVDPMTEKPVITEW